MFEGDQPRKTWKNIASMIESKHEALIVKVLL